MIQMDYLSKKVSKPCYPRHPIGSGPGPRAKEKGRGKVLYTQPLVNDEAHHSKKVYSSASHRHSRHSGARSYPSGSLSPQYQQTPTTASCEESANRSSQVSTL